MLSRNFNLLTSVEVRKLSRLQFNGLLKLLKPCTVNKTQQAFITGKAARTDRPPRPPPFDYKNKAYKYWNVLTDPMFERFDDNSKIVVIDGLPATGKDKFAKKLAEELEMHYMPPPRFSDLLVDEYGFDYRTLNSQLPVDAQFFDEKTFLENPTGRNSTAIQVNFFSLRYHQYLIALTHLLSTGEGVVIQRCPWSDMVFMHAMKDCGYVPQRGYDYYKSCLEYGLHRILRPHLVIYLDIPASIVKERIKQRGLPHEVNSKALTIEYLSNIERYYKDNYLPTISNHAHTLVYDWTNEGDMIFIVDDIEQLQFENYPRENPKMGDWKFDTRDDQRAARGFYANDRLELLNNLQVPRFDVPEMLITGQDVEKRKNLIGKLQDQGVIAEYEKGFNYDRDEGVLWRIRRLRK
ncbi:NADH dehydrogenase [ubiquinone] 1 alpha subcomplex subunit 10, mitochondrial [Chelonus insularis]|uniref:NADH dehydrogenase [ubiquinone] 1 alpha subcomplex subunit 10, mitochondrial n=1 Tax=Chelonus insularis TaxID=460826 RepID=UPI00158B510E|nr:NADH dehydrogenase [ubiquinone] 1 alpha subcomplex subunit 10, mitochondrial [Chelonus insularis]XP_034933992.1 NADH dehydrogenase [ubiquinone] 1 alpha subcomplex subunit 10, mitochondrial [Chelonus insularis]XP_034933993.1 NADH dehydrogenase [ubiquinone] 1 alpha subcomplex subunit 10, mitochondrial [Chelonus insularis]XP_034933994.1 NADH dehydrogenase [ubiquinone] 1 alpha subcomplex subunit 10, mitochondrial [Chelonus insularis]